MHFADWRSKALEDEEIFEQIHLVEALTRLEDQRSAATIALIFDTTPHSFLRVSCARGLAVFDQTFGDERATECLWDCEGDTRAIAVERARLTPRVQARLAFMVDDVIEEDRVRALAAARLAASI